MNQGGIYMATVRSVNSVKARLSSQSKVANRIEENLCISIVGKRRPPQEIYKMNVKGTSGIRAKKYFVGINQSE